MLFEDHFKILIQYASDWNAISNQWRYIE